MQKELILQSNQLDSFEGIEINHYQCLNILGNGQFGIVYKGINLKNKKDVAIKIVDKSKIENQSSEKIREMKRKLLKSEGQILKKCKSDYIIKCYDIFQNEQFMIFILQYCNGGDLNKRLRNKKSIPQKQAVIILKQIINGFAELHRNNVIHRDLKPENIFIHNNFIKIGDLGFAKVIGDLVDNTNRTMLGTLTTMAPEIMSQGTYGIKADLWSLGVIYYRMIYGCYPIMKYKHLNQILQNYKYGFKIVKEENVSDESMSLLKKILVIDPEKRINWGDLYKHPLLINIKISRQPQKYQSDLILSQSIHSKIQQQKKQDLKMVNVIKNIEQDQEIIVQKPIILKSSIHNSLLRKQKFKEQMIQNKKQIQVSILKYLDQLEFIKLKAHLIFTQVFEVIINNHIIIKKNLVFYEFAYLIICRCFFIITKIYSIFYKRSNLFKWEFYQQFIKENHSYSNLGKQVKQFNEIITKQKMRIQTELYAQEKKLSSQIVNTFDKIINKNEYETKLKFLTGIQNIDYIEDQHSLHILYNYVPIIIKNLKSQQTTQVQKRIINKMENFLNNHYEKVSLAVYPEHKQYLQELKESAQKFCQM